MADWRWIIDANTPCGTCTPVMPPPNWCPQPPVGSGYLPLSGGQMTGPLILAADPVVPLGASTKQYVDAAVATALSLSGGTVTGPLILQNLATSSVGLAPGTVWNNGGVLCVA